MRPVQALLTAAALCLTVSPLTSSAQLVPLASTWQTYDPNNLCTLSAQSASGFTALIATNTTGNTDFVPRIFQTFADQPFTNNGTRIGVTFDLVFLNPTVVGDTQLRFGLCNTNVNELIMAMYDIGAPNGTSVRSRMDQSQAPGITSPGPHVPGNWNSAFIAGFNLTGGLNGGTSSGAPNNVGLGVAATLSTKHSFRYSVERTPGQLLQDCIWSNSAGAAFIGISAFYDELANSTNTPPTWQQVNAFAIGSNNNGMFGAAGGQYTISNLKIYNGFRITASTRDPITGDVLLTWESSPYDYSLGANYNIQTTTNLTNPDAWNTVGTTTSTPNLTTGFYTSYTVPGTTDGALYYRVQKVYP